VIQRLHELTDPSVGITIVTKIELLRGRHDYLLKAATGVEMLKAQRLLFNTASLLELLQIFPLNETAVAHFDRLRGTKGLRKIGRADLLTASIALAHGAILVTRNVRHFHPISGLTVVNWVD
jgi:tRNA(fMet)-specific endonuclease VapC